MRTIIIKLAIHLLIVIFLFTSCNKEPIPITPLTPPPPLGNPQPIAKATPYDLDITLNATYKFYDNLCDPWQYAIADSNFDLTEIIGKVNLTGLGEFDINVGEYADTAFLSDKIYWDYIDISLGHVNPLYISGDHSINLKKLIRGGGGAFNGTLKITSGSAQKSDYNIFPNLPPLTVTGTLDVNTQVVILKIKGKTYF